MSYGVTYMAPKDENVKCPGA